MRGLACAALGLLAFAALAPVSLSADAAPAYRVAQGYGLDNWQSRAFRAIETQKRLDRLRKGGGVSTGERKKQRTRRTPATRNTSQAPKENTAPQEAATAMPTGAGNAAGTAVKTQTIGNPTHEPVAAKVVPAVEKPAPAVSKAVKPVAKAPEVVKADVSAAQSAHKAEMPAVDESFKVVRAPARIQACLAKTGHYKGAVTGRLDARTFAAFERFRAALKDVARPDDLFDPVLQQKMFAACAEESAPKRIVEKMPSGAPASEDAERSIVSTGQRNDAGDALPQPAPDLPPVFASPEPALQPPSAGRSTLVPAGKSTDRLQPGAAAIPSDAATHRRISRLSRRIKASDLTDLPPSQPDRCARETAANMSVRREAAVSLPQEAPLYTGAISAPAIDVERTPQPRAMAVRTTKSADGACLPRDIYDLVIATHGDKPDLSVCADDCLPVPKTFSAARRQRLARQFAINWCGSDCLSIAEPMSLADVTKVEHDAKVEVCMTPQSRLVPAVKKGLDADGVNATIRALYDRLPGGYGNDNNIAVIIGNRNYGGDLPVNDDGHINAAAMRALLIEQLGYKPSNVISLKDATHEDMRNLFGWRDNPAGELYSRLKAHRNAQLLIYYSGHAASRGLGLENYLLPIDAVIGHETETGYPLEVLYDNLRALDARSSLLFLETGFTNNRSHLVHAPNLAERRVTVAPIIPLRGLAVFTAGEGDQKPLVDVETGIGLFTRYLISGLAGAADARPYGNGDSIIDSVELYAHLARHVRLAARKTLGLMQNPTLSRSDNLFLSQLSKADHRR